MKQSCIYAISHLCFTICRPLYVNNSKLHAENNVGTV